MPDINEKSFGFQNSNLSTYGVKDEVPQRAKLITIYTLTPDKDSKLWHNIVAEITTKLTLNNIRPGYRSPDTDGESERLINGSNYVTYRYDYSENNILRLLNLPIVNKKKIRLSN